MTHPIPNDPTKGLWRRFLLLIPLVAVLALASYLYIRSFHGTYVAHGVTAFQDVTLGPEHVKVNKPGVVEVVRVQQDAQGCAIVEFRAVSDGSVEVSVGTPTVQDYFFLDVRRGGIIEGSVNFSGWQAVHVSFCVLLLALTALFASVAHKLVKASWYGYEMVAAGGGLLFCTFQLLLQASFLFFDRLWSFDRLLMAFTDAVPWFDFVTLLPMAVMAVLVSVSNISLIRHEGLRPANLLGIILSIVWVLAEIAWFQWWQFSTNMKMDLKAIVFVDCLLAIAISFAECLLLSTIISAWQASRHVPKQAMDYLVVLGCGIRDDGTPCPLLAGRVDRAYDFDQAHVAAGDAPATFVPSGGQGPDEVISEAQSMADYLAGKGVSRDRIVLEDRSTTTRENMFFSREVIERHAGRSTDELRVGFSTTNYHVFRGYVYAHQAGMAVEGMGSKTKYYFWPNAFLREFAGLLVNQWRGILQLFLLIAAFYIGAEYVIMFGVI